MRNYVGLKRTTITIILFLIMMFHGIKVHALLRNNNNKLPEEEKPSSEEILLKKASANNADYLALAKDFLTKKKKKQTGDEATVVQKNIIVDCGLYKLVKSRDDVIEELGTLRKANKKVHKELKSLNKIVNDINDYQNGNKRKRKTNRHDRNSQWRRPTKVPKKVLKRIKILNDEDQDNKIKIAKLNTKKFELTESIELKNLNRLRETKQTHHVMPPDAPSSFGMLLELKEHCDEHV